MEIKEKIIRAKDEVVISQDQKVVLRQLLENLCYNTMGNPSYRIDEVHTAILNLFSALSTRKE